MWRHRSINWTCGLSGFALASLLCSTALGQSTAFTYQGRLEAGGAPATGTYDFQFTLYDAASGGALIAGPVPANNVDVADGLFTVQLDFGAAVFDGTDRFVDIAVKRVSEPPDPDFVPLNPRQPITPAPVALFALNAGGVDGGLTLPFSGEGTAAEPNCVFSISNNGSGKAICGTNSSSTDGAQGVFGRASAMTGVTYGVTGESASPNGRGVYGRTTANSDVNYGGYFQSDSPAGVGVLGYTSATTGNAWGVWGESKSPNGRGVAGFATATSGTAHGVYGRSWSSGGLAGYFEKLAAASTALRAIAGGASGIGNLPPGAVHGDSNTSDGVVGSTSGANRSGVFGISSSPSGHGGWFQNSGGGVALRAVGRAQVNVLEILGGADLAEPFDVMRDGSADPSVTPGMVVAIDPENPGRLRVCTTAYDRKAAGIISGANGLKAGMVMKSEGDAHTEGQWPVALTGRVWCWCDASDGPIQPGDLLTTSDVPGYAMTATDLTRAQGATLGKAMTALAQGERGLVLVLVNLQ